MNSNDFISSGILETYVMGQCTLAEQQEVERYALQYPEVRTEINAICDVLEFYSLSYEKTPPAYLKEKISNTVKQIIIPERKNEAKIISLKSGKEISPGTKEKIFKLLAAASIALLIMCSAILYRALSEKDKLSDEVALILHDNSKLTDEIQKQKNSLAQMQKTMEIWQQDMALLKKPSMVPMEMKGMPIAPDSKAMVYLDTKTNDVYLEINKLPKAPDGMQYQLWAIVKGKPVSAGMITLCEQPDTCGIRKIANIEAHAFAISLEKKGENSSTPQGNIYAAFGI